MPDRLRDFVPARRRAHVCVNACDQMAAADRQLRLDRELTALTALGFVAEELDLRQFFAAAPSAASLSERMTDIDLLWVRGGNTFLLRRAYRQSGLDRILPALLTSATFVYGGYSAAGAVLSPTLRGYELVDPPDELAPGYDEAVIWEGLGIIPYQFVPHFESDHPESPGASLLAAHYTRLGVPFKTLRDGQVIVVDGRREEVLG